METNESLLSCLESSVVSNLKYLQTDFGLLAGPKRGQPCLGFPDFVRPSVRPSVHPSIRTSVRPSPFGLVLSYTANIPQTPYILKIRTPFKMTIRGDD